MSGGPAFRKDLHGASTLPADHREKANPIERIEPEPPASAVTPTALGKKALEPVARPRLTKRSALCGKAERENRRAGTLLINLLAIHETSAAACLAYGADEAAGEPNLERPHSWTLTVADLGTTTRR